MVYLVRLIPNKQATLLPLEARRWQEVAARLATGGKTPLATGGFAQRQDGFYPVANSRWQTAGLPPVIRQSRRMVRYGTRRDRRQNHV